jgi:hypothetical protein
MKIYMLKPKDMWPLGVYATKEKAAEALNEFYSNTKHNPLFDGNYKGSCFEVFVEEYEVE